MEEINYDNIRIKRAAFLVGTWKFLSESGQINKEVFTLSMPLLEEVVEHYLDDLKTIKGRYKIKNNIQLHKVAGLTASAILRYRPIIPTSNKYERTSDIYVNELFAVIHGLAICGEYSLDQCEALSGSKWIDRWMDDFLHLLHRRNHTPESLAFIFQTLSTWIFPKNLEVFEDDTISVEE